MVLFWHVLLQRYSRFWMATKLLSKGVHDQNLIFTFPTTGLLSLFVEAPIVKAFVSRHLVNWCHFDRILRNDAVIQFGARQHVVCFLMCFEILSL